MSETYGIHVDESKDSFNPFVMAKPDEVAPRIVRILEGKSTLTQAEVSEQAGVMPKSAE